MARDARDTLPIGLAAGLSFATFTVLLVLHAKAKQPQLAAMGEQIAPQVAEEAVKSWITSRFGITPADMQRLGSSTTPIGSLIGALRR